MAPYPFIIRCKRLLSLSAAILLLTPVKGQDSGIQPTLFARADHAPGWMLAFPTVLSRRLCHDLTTDEDKALVITYWTALHLKPNKRALRRYSQPAFHWWKITLFRRGTMQDYARVCERLADHAKVDLHVVSGYGKGFPYEPDDRLIEENAAVNMLRTNAMMDCPSCFLVYDSFNGSFRWQPRRMLLRRQLFRYFGIPFRQRYRCIRDFNPQTICQAPSTYQPEFMPAQPWWQQGIQTMPLNVFSSGKDTILSFLSTCQRGNQFVDYSAEQHAMKPEHRYRFEAGKASFAFDTINHLGIARGHLQFVHTEFQRFQFHRNGVSGIATDLCMPLDTLDSIRREGYYHARQYRMELKKNYLHSLQKNKELHRQSIEEIIRTQRSVRQQMSSIRSNASDLSKHDRKCRYVKQNVVRKSKVTLQIAHQSEPESQRPYGSEGALFEEKTAELESTYKAALDSLNALNLNLPNEIDSLARSLTVLAYRQTVPLNPVSDSLFACIGRRMGTRLMFSWWDTEYLLRLESTGRRYDQQQDSLLQSWLENEHRYLVLSEILNDHAKLVFKQQAVIIRTLVKMNKRGALAFSDGSSVEAAEREWKEGMLAYEAACRTAVSTMRDLKRDHLRFTRSLESFLKPQRRALKREYHAEFARFQFCTTEYAYRYRRGRKRAHRLLQDFQAERATYKRLSARCKARAEM